MCIQKNIVTNKIQADRTGMYIWSNLKKIQWKIGTTHKYTVSERKKIQGFEHPEWTESSITE